MKRIAILGSTGSIGTQTLDIVREHPLEYEAYMLTANRSADKLIEQAREFHPEIVVISDETLYQKVKEGLADMPIKVFAGPEAVCDAVQSAEIDIVVTAMVGFAGLCPTISAIKAGKTIALANKETLVVAGQLIMDLALKYRAAILPVDSEHSAIFQSIVGEQGNKIHKILLTASGGPFRTHSIEQLKNVTAQQALQHPNWKMGAKITIDSATMMNKGFEMIEAKWLFSVLPEDIEVVIHPESIIHSAVQFADGAVKAQMGIPDMRLPIQYALSFPKRLHLSDSALDLFAVNQFNFERPDMERFDCLKIAYEAAQAGKNVPCIVNAANEVANAAFREGLIRFTDIPALIRRAMDNAPQYEEQNLEVYLHSDHEVRELVSEYIKNR